MKNYGMKFAWIAALIVGSLVAIWSYGIKLGIDLSGGTILEYQLREGAQADSQTMDALIAALKKRLNPEGVADIPIRKVGNNRLEIILADESPEEVERLKRKIIDVGSLEFRILANYKHDQSAMDRIDRGNEPPTGYEWMQLGEVIRGGKDQEGKPIPGAPTAEIVGPSEIRLPGRSIPRDRYNGAFIILKGQTSARDAAEVERRVEIAGNYDEVVKLAKPHELASISSYVIDYNPGEIVASGQKAAGDPYIKEVDLGKGEIRRQVLVAKDRQNVTGEYLARTFPTQDERMQPAVGFVFNSAGARKFGQLTGSHLPEENGQFRYRLAVILDGLLRSAPSINSEIRDSGIIEGIQPEEQSYLIEILQSGSLPASIDPTPLLEEKVGSLLGRDTIEKGKRAIMIALTVVPIFMLFYYHLAGAVAVFALFLNMLLLVASMSVTGSSFTLPGLAGLALTIGMAVDANVLIFERMREEKERGAPLLQQIRNGYDRAWSTIFDSNVTTVLSGAVLWAVGTQEVKGFALTLIIGLIWNLFTAVVVTRLIFEFLYGKGWIKQLTMLKVFGKTNIDFVGPRRYFIAASIVAIAIGLALFFTRGSSMYNIDFTGGTLVSFRLNSNAEVNGRRLESISPAARSEYVRQTAGQKLDDVTVESITLADQSQESGYRYNVRTTNESVADVQKAVQEVFAPTLGVVTTAISDPKPIPAPAADQPKAEAEPVSDAAAAAAAEEKAKSATTPGVKQEPRVQFAGGQEYSLTFNRGVEMATVQDLASKTLAAMGEASPADRFAVLPVYKENGELDSRRVSLLTSLAGDEAGEFLAGLKDNLRKDPSLIFDRLENFGGAVAGETRSLAVVAIVGSWLMIIAYLWLRFKSFSFGLAAVIALVHDVLIALGAVALTHYLGFLGFSPYKIDLPMVAAFLTLIGFSVNDTIVIFDRIRELRGKAPTITHEMINQAVNQTLSRTFLTSLTAWLVVVIFYVFGGEGLRAFSFCLVIGFLSGTYSTIFIAAPILIEWYGHGGKQSPKVKSLAGAR